MTATERFGVSDSFDVTARIEPTLNGLVVFPRRVVIRALTEAGKANIIKEEALIMNQPIRDFSERLTVRRPYDKGPEGLSRVAGFTLAHRILRYTSLATGYRLPVLDNDYVKNFEEYVFGISGMLGDWFEQDYNRHPAVLKLINNLSNDHSKEGAMVLFTLYGRMVNPTRKPRDIPERSAALPHFGKPLPVWATGKSSRSR